MKTDTIRAYLFKDSKPYFLELLEKNRIDYAEKQLFPPGTIVNSGEAVEIIKAIGGA